jgi:succinyl-CoA:acetate CoA-transferase
MDTGDRDLVYFGEGIQDGLLDMLDSDQFSSASATSLALSRQGQKKLFSNINRYSEDLVLRPTDVSNSPALINRFGVVAVNSALEVDIFGHVNSTHVNGTSIINGIGGSGDFTRNAFISIIALPSSSRDSAYSRIVPMVPHVDHTEHETDIIITEHGIADLRGLSPLERGREMIETCADPEFKEALRQYLQRGESQDGHIPHDLESAFTWE